MEVDHFFLLSCSLEKMIFGRIIFFINYSWPMHSSCQLIRSTFFQCFYQGGGNYFQGRLSCRLIFVGRNSPLSSYSRGTIFCRAIVRKLSVNDSKFPYARTQQSFPESSKLMDLKIYKNIFDCHCILPKLSKHVSILKYLSFILNSSFSSFTVCQ